MLVNITVPRREGFTVGWKIPQGGESSGSDPSLQFAFPPLAGCLHSPQRTPTASDVVGESIKHYLLVPGNSWEVGTELLDSIWTWVIVSISRRSTKEKLLAEFEVQLDF